jgi:hypothetical protein
MQRPDVGAGTATARAAKHAVRVRQWPAGQPSVIAGVLARGEPRASEPPGLAQTGTPRLFC